MQNSDTKEIRDRIAVRFKDFKGAGSFAKRLGRSTIKSLRATVRRDSSDEFLATVTGNGQQLLELVDRFKLKPNKRPNYNNDAGSRTGTDPLRTRIAELEKIVREQNEELETLRRIKVQHDNLKKIYINSKEQMSRASNQTRQKRVEPLMCKVCGFNMYRCSCSG